MIEEWKMVQAREIARKAAEKLAAEARLRREAAENGPCRFPRHQDGFVQLDDLRQACRPTPP